MQIWLSQGVERLRLPVLPSGFEVNVSQQNNSINVVSLGEVNIIGKRGLKTLPLSSFFPSQEYGVVQYKGFPKPYKCVELIESWLSDPIHIIITETNINMDATIESFTHSEQDATGDVYYTLELKEYRRPGVREVAPKMNKESTKIEVSNLSRNSKSIKTTNYTVKQNDTLFDISKRITGSANNMYAIANQNNIKNPNIIHIGQKLVIKV
ncbi:MAG: xkdP [Herbinix sp.]|jgi:nucleoid-associated protein YgaU|nr:xkdP [Herbinix sp.]